MTNGKRLLLRLSRYSRCQYEGLYPPEMTQDGIAETLGISTGNVSVLLKRLMDAGCVYCKLEHVKGGKTRRKVYFVTPKGENIAEDCREEGKGRHGGKEGHPGRAEKDIAPKPDVVDAHGPVEDANAGSASTYSFSFSIDE